MPEEGFRPDLNNPKTLATLKQLLQDRLFIAQTTAEQDGNLNSPSTQKRLNSIRAAIRGVGIIDKANLPHNEDLLDLITEEEHRSAVGSIREASLHDLHSVVNSLNDISNDPGADERTRVSKDILIKKLIDQIGDDDYNFPRGLKKYQLISDRSRSFRLNELKEALPNSILPPPFKIEEVKGRFTATVAGTKAANKQTTPYSTFFDTEKEARKFLLSKLREQEVLSSNYECRIPVSSNQILGAVKFEDFDPQMAPSDNPRKITNELKAAVMEDRTGPINMRTYIKTQAEINSERSLFIFCAHYLQDRLSSFPDFQGLDIHALTPKQAISLSLAIVMDLKSYDLGVADKADNQTALELLQAGLDKTSGKGNGVCRNFASTTKAIFEALKMYQYKYNRLEDTYCFYTGTSNDKRNDHTLADPDGRHNFKPSDGHGWNSFVVVGEKETINTIVDPTWGRLSESGHLENVDFTGTRFELYIRGMLKNLPQDTTDRERKLRAIYRYYLSQHENLEGRERRDSFMCRAIVSLAKKKDEQGYPMIPSLPIRIIHLIIKEYSRQDVTLDRYQLESIYHIAGSQKSKVIRDLLPKYLERVLNREHIFSNNLLFKNRGLAIAAYNHLQKIGQLQKIARDPAIRIEVRSATPALLLLFRGLEDPSDTAELQELIKRSTSLREKLEAQGISLDTTPEKFTINIKKRKQRLREIILQTLIDENQQEYPKLRVPLKLYDLVLQYDMLFEKLSNHTRPKVA